MNNIEGNHYVASAMQPIQVMQAIMTPEQFRGFLLGNIIKYRIRCNHKGQHDSDIAKSLQYRYWYDLARHGKTIEPDKDKTPDGYEWRGIE